jgi:alkyl sulfatase BDS1-like metallo-beta-lactamase superfamily hydrolase
MGYTVAELFKTMKERFKPEVVGDLEATIVYEFGDGRKWTVRIAQGDLDVEPGDSARGQENARVIFEKEEIMLGIISHKIALLKAIFSKDLRVTGDWELLARVRSAFDPPRELLENETCGRQG